MQWVKRSFAEVLAILAMAGVVILLAALQYKWTGQISGIEQKQMEGALDTAVKDFGQEFSYDFERLCESFELTPDRSPQDFKAKLLDRYASWIATTSRPGLLGGLYIWKPSDRGNASLESLRLHGNRFEQVAWPESFGSLAVYLNHQAQRLSAPIPDREASYYPWTFYRDSALLVRPLFEILPEREDAPGNARPAGFLIVELNGDFLRSTYFPELAQRHFGKLDFAIAVGSLQARAHPVYSSDAGFPSSAKSPDAEMNLLESVAEEAHRRGRPSARGSDPSMQWELVAQHRAGSLEAAVGSWRRRNFAISLGLLSVLAASMILIFLVARRAERFARLQMEFVASVSHELCTPLAVINSAVENLADGVVDNPGQVQEYAGILRDQGVRLERLLDQVLLFASSRVKSERHELRTVHVALLVEQSVAAARPILLDAGFAVEKTISPDLPPVMADAATVSKCLENLISNAMKYAGTTRRLAICAGTARQNSHIEVQISVADAGIGIAEPDLPHIFEPFYRVQAVREGRARGVGLGLHLVKQMMEGMGGKVSVTSELGRGSCFVLHFQLSESQNGSDRPDRSV
jgi:signal transduction histidine kinase